MIDKATLKAYYEDEGEKVIKPIRTFFSRKRELKVDFLVKAGPAADNIVAAATKGVTTWSSWVRTATARWATW